MQRWQVFWTNKRAAAVKWTRFCNVQCFLQGNAAGKASSDACCIPTPPSSKSGWDEEEIIVSKSVGGLIFPG